MKTIAWFSPEDMRDPSIRTMMKENDIRPMLNDTEAIKLWEEMSKPETMFLYGFGWAGVTYPKYFDEPYSIDPPKSDIWVRDVLLLHPDIIIGDTNPSKIAKLVKLGCKNITYTAYKPFWFTLFGHNIQKFWKKNQIEEWEKMEDEYGYKHYWTNNDKDIVVERESIFENCWINLGSNQGDYPALIKWIEEHGKDCLLVFNQEDSVEKKREQLTEFCTAKRVRQTELARSRLRKFCQIIKGQRNENL